MHFGTPILALYSRSIYIYIHHYNYLFVHTCNCTRKVIQDKSRPLVCLLYIHMYVSHSLSPHLRSYLLPHPCQVLLRAPPTSTDWQLFCSLAGMTGKVAIHSTRQSLVFRLKPFHSVVHIHAMPTRADITYLKMAQV